MTYAQHIDFLREQYVKSLYALSRIGLNYPDVNAKTHGDIVKSLESTTERKLICVPRGSLKSSICCVAYPIWRLINNPNERILITSELYTNSKNFLREIKAHFESDTMRTLFGEFKSQVWNESEIIIRQRTTQKKEASITVGGVGTTKVGQHYDTIICDDLNSPDNTNSPENAEKVITYYKYLTSILEPKGTMVIVGTRYHELDVIGHIIQNELLEDGLPETKEYEVA